MVQALGGPLCVSASPALAQTREGAPFPTVHPQPLTSIPLKADFVALIRLYQEVMGEKKVLSLLWREIIFLPLNPFHTQ